MAADATAHAFADQEKRSDNSLAHGRKRVSMRADEFREAVRPFSAFSHVIVIKRLDLPNNAESFLPSLHPRMRRRGSRAGCKQKKRFHGAMSILPASKRATTTSGLVSCLGNNYTFAQPSGQRGFWLRAALLVGHTSTWDMLPPRALPAGQNPQPQMYSYFRDRTLRRLT